MIAQNTIKSRVEKKNQMVSLILKGKGPQKLINKLMETKTFFLKQNKRKGKKSDSLKDLTDDFDGRMSVCVIQKSGREKNHSF